VDTISDDEGIDIDIADIGDLPDDFEIEDFGSDIDLPI
jgi:hypothetical protein